MGKTLKITFVVVATLAVLCHAGYAAEEGEMREGKARMANRSERFNRIAEELELSRDQAETLRLQKEKKRAERKELYNRRKTLRAELREELKKIDSDSEAIEAIVDQINRIQARITRHRVETFLEIKEILTFEQFQKMIDLKENRKRT